MSRNVEGLKNISGERIWMEMSKILIGDNLTDTIELMDEVGLFEIIGLPGFRISVRERAKTELTINPITVLAIGCKTRADARAVSNTINNWWKVPAEDRALFSFLVAKGFHMQQYDAAHNIGKLKESAVQPKANVRFVTELSAFVDVKLFDLFMQWEVPTFPVRGQDLIESGMPPGPGIGIALSSMLEQWIKSDFKLTKEDLLN
jgi:tRNA nucleotidyltransferase (CCA-adding enzyme)